MMISTDVSVWIAALMTIAIISFVFKYNPLFRFAESSGIAVTMGWIVVGALKNIRDIGINPISKGEFLLIIPIIFGILLFTRFYTEYAHMSRWGAAIITGTGIGLAMRRALDAQIFAQITATSLSLRATSTLTIFNNLVFLLCLITTLAYFFFTIERKGGLNVIATIGRYAIMARFGTAYGATVMGRLSLMVARLQFLLLQWLGLG